MKVFIQKPVMGGSVKIYVMEIIDGEKFNHTYNSEEKMITRILMPKYEANEAVPFFEFPELFFNDLMKAFADYASENKIKPESESLLQGKLEVTEMYLKDIKGYFEKTLDKVLKIK